MDEVQGMTRDDIIRMAREAGLNLYVNDVTEEPYAVILERFASLVAAHTLSNIDPSRFMSWQEGYAAGAAAEREACAKVCENTDFDSDADFYRPDFAAAIRARGETE